MPTYDVDVGGKTYEVDAPDPNTAWRWANYTARQEAQKSERTWGEAVTDVALVLFRAQAVLYLYPVNSMVLPRATSLLLVRLD